MWFMRLQRKKGIVGGFGVHDQGCWGLRFVYEGGGCFSRGQGLLT